MSAQEHYYPAIDNWYNFLNSIRNTYKFTASEPDATLICFSEIMFTYNGDDYRGSVAGLRTTITADTPLKMKLSTPLFICSNLTQNTTAVVSFTCFFDKANRTDNTKTYWNIDINGQKSKITDLETLRMYFYIYS
jgi:hypothetical protein